MKSLVIIIQKCICKCVNKKKYIMDKIQLLKLKTELLNKIKEVLQSFMKDKKIIIEEDNNYAVFHTAIEAVENFPEEAYINFFEEYFKGTPQKIIINVSETFKKKKFNRAFKRQGRSMYYLDAIIIHNFQTIRLVYNGKKTFEWNSEWICPLVTRVDFFEFKKYKIIF